MEEPHPYNNNDKIEEELKVMKDAAAGATIAGFVYLIPFIILL